MRIIKDDAHCWDNAINKTKYFIYVYKHQGCHIKEIPIFKIKFFNCH